MSKCKWSKTQITMWCVLVTDVETFGNMMVRIRTRERFTFHRVKQSHIKEDKRKRGKTDLVEMRRKRTTNVLNCLSLCFILLMNVWHLSIKTIIMCSCVCEGEKENTNDISKWESYNLGACLFCCDCVFVSGDVFVCWCVCTRKKNEDIEMIRLWHLYK